MPASLEIIHLDETRFEAACRLLARAFQNDPLHSRACPDPEARARWLPFYFSSFIWKSHLNGVLLGTTAPLAGVAAAIQPGGAHVVDDEWSRECDRRAREALGDAAWEQYNSAFDEMFEPAEHHLQEILTEPHWYLDMLAVDPEMQGQGIGGMLLRRFNAIADTGNHPVGLLTFQADNLPFYARHGYEIIAESDGDGTGLRSWILRSQALADRGETT